MTHTHKQWIRTSTLCMGLLPLVALAHPGHGAGDSFLAGALHPASGIDHVAGFVLVGMLASRLGKAALRPMAAALLGLLVAASTAGSDGWQYAAGFMLTGAGLAAAAMAATRLMTSASTAVARRSRIWVEGAAAAHRPFARH